MSVGLDDLRREILWSAAEGICHGAVGGLLDLGKAEISQLQMAR